MVIIIRKFKELTGQKFGRLTALYRLHNLKGNTKWLCICDCGNLIEVTIQDLKSRNTKSCGCLRKDMAINRNIRHGKRHTRLYRVYSNIKGRCYNVNNKRYHDYGSRGITMCDEWKNNFMSFYDWSMNNGYKDTLTIDRIDVNGNYEPNNCRWVDYKTQNRNKRNNRCIVINGESHCLSEWCEILGLNLNTVRSRIYNRKWTIERALGLEEK